MTALFARCIAAVRFLTIFPVPGTLGREREELAGAVPSFPLVGLMLGLLSGGISWVLWSVLPPLVAAVLLTTCLLGYSGGLHVDGLADTADGFCSARSRERILDIMRDSRIGAMGVAALVLLLLTKISTLATLPAAAALQAAILMPIAGRVGIVILMALLPYARKEEGLGTLFYSRRSRWSAVWAFCFLFFVLLLTIGWNCWLPMSLFFFILLGFALLCRRIIGGATGDTLGAACEIGEACIPLAFSFLFWSNQ